MVVNDDCCDGLEIQLERKSRIASRYLNVTANRSLRAQKERLEFRSVNTCFPDTRMIWIRWIFAHLQAVKTMVYSNVVYCPNVVVGWRSGVRRCRLCVQCEGCCSSIAVNHSITLLKMEKKLPETCWADSKINKTVIVASSWPFMSFTYTDDARSHTNQI
jgi:hypothetical protein